MTTVGIQEIKKQKQRRKVQTELNDHFLEFVKEFCLDDTVTNRRDGEFHSVLSKTRNWLKILRIYHSLITIKYLPLGVKEG